MIEPVVMECPRCGRLWVGLFRYGASTDRGYYGRVAVFTPLEEEQLSGGAPHHDVRSKGGSHWANRFNPCRGTPERHHRPDVMAAWHLGGKEAAEALWPARTLGIAIEEYERISRGY